MRAQCRPLSRELALHEDFEVDLGREVTPCAVERGRLTPRELRVPAEPRLFPVGALERTKERVIGQPIAVLVEGLRELVPRVRAAHERRTCFAQAPLAEASRRGVAGTRRAGQ